MVQFAGVHTLQSVGDLGDALQDLSRGECPVGAINQILESTGFAELGDEQLLGVVGGVVLVHKVKNVRLLC